MRKIALLLIMVIIGTAAFAAAAKPAASKGTEGQGFTAITLNSIPGVPSARFGFGSWSLDAGGSIANAANTTTITLLLKGEIPMTTVSSDVKTYIAPALVLVSGGGTSTTTINVFLGAEYMFNPHLALFADLTAFTLTSVGGTTNWTIGGNSALIYSGGRLYL